MNPHFGQYNAGIVKDIFDDYLKSRIDFAKVQLLDLSCYLENYLWRHYSADSSVEHILSTIIMINEKFREGISVFDYMTSDEEKFHSFFGKIVEIAFQSHESNSSAYGNYRVSYTLFLINTYRSLESKIVRQCALKYLSLSMWESLSEARLESEFESNPQLKKHWMFLENQKIERKVKLDSVHTINVNKNDSNEAAKSKIGMVLVECVVLLPAVLPF